MFRDAERARPRDYDTEEAMLQRARDALFRFATDSTAGYSNARFLSLHTTATLDELRRRTDAMVDSLLALLAEAGVKHACADAWSPERLAATACFHDKCIDDAKGAGSRWRARAWQAFQIIRPEIASRTSACWPCTCRATAEHTRPRR